MIAASVDPASRSFANRSPSTTTARAPQSATSAARLCANSHALSGTSTAPIASTPQAQIDHSG
ncbi:MAG: hypothetical protein QM703_28385 [Gemmatales bacterium]